MIVNSVYIVKSSYTFRWIFPTYRRYVTDTLKKCMCKFDAGFFLDKMAGFLTLRQLHLVLITLCTNTICTNFRLSIKFWLLSAGYLICTANWHFLFVCFVLVQQCVNMKQLRLFPVEFYNTCLGQNILFLN